MNRIAAETAAAFTFASTREFDDLRNSTIRDWPHIKAGLSDHANEARISRVFSALHTADGDAVEIQLEIQQSEETLWVEATLYLGQRTLMVLSNCFWPQEEPLTKELDALIAEFVSVIASRFNRALSVAAATEK